MRKTFRGLTTQQVTERVTNAKYEITMLDFSHSLPIAIPKVYSPVRESSFPDNGLTSLARKWDSNDGT